MIFKQYAEVLLSEKTLTTRVRLPAHIAVGKEWAIVPKRAAPAWWLHPFNREIITSNMAYHLFSTYTVIQRPSGKPPKMRPEDYGYVQARIKIAAYWQTPLQQMTELEALDEGVASVDAYSRLWNSINKAKGVRWEDNPQVWRIRFSVTKDVAEAVSRVGRAAIREAAGK